MEYDDLFEYVGHMGRLQLIIYVVIFLLNVLCMDFVNVIFVGGEMEHWCSVEALKDLPPDQQKYVAIPAASSNDVSDDDMSYSSCEMFNVNWTEYSVDELRDWNRTLWMTDIGNMSTEVTRCTAWNYDHSIYKSSIVSAFNLVCGREFLIELTITFQMIGPMVGTLSCGLISDRFGRKLSLLLYLSVKALGGATAIFSRDYATFVTGRFICGVGTAGTLLISFVLVMEICGPKYRTTAGAGLQLSYSLGFMLVPSLAYFLRDEFTLQLTTTGPCVLFIPFVIWMPESPRWLVVKRKYDEGRRVLQRFCRANETTLPDCLHLTDIVQEESVQGNGCSALARSSAMLYRTVIMIFSWFTSSLVYCALSMFSGYQNVSGSLYLSTLINGAVEIPVNAAAIFIIEWKPLGRRRTACMSLIGAGITSFASALFILYDMKLVAIVTSLLGKAFITLAYSVVYVYGSEIFPTEVRNVGIGLASTFECLGGVLAPTIGGYMKRVWLPLPSVIYGICSSISGLSLIYLPETLGKPLPDTVAQADAIAAAHGKRKTKHSVTSAIETDANANAKDTSSSSISKEYLKGVCADGGEIQNLRSLENGYTKAEFEIIDGQPNDLRESAC